MPRSDAPPRRTQACRNDARARVVRRRADRDYFLALLVPRGTTGFHPLPAGTAVVDNVRDTLTAHTQGCRNDARGTTQRRSIAQLWDLLQD